MLPQVVSDYRRGRKVTDIMKDHKVQPTVLYKALREAGIPLRRRKYQVSGEPNPSTVARARLFKALSDGGMTLQEIADLQNPKITRERVRQLMVKYTDYNGRPLGYYVGRKVSPISENEKAAYQEYLTTRSSNGDIANKYGIKPSRLQTVIKRMGERRERADPNITERNRQVVWHYFNSLHLSLDDIAKMYGLSHGCVVNNFVKRAGFKPCRMGKAEDTLRAKVLALLRTGLNDVAEIAKQTGAKPNYVQALRWKWRTGKEK